MRFLFSAPALLSFAAALIALSVSILSWRRRSIPGALEFSLMMAFVFLWAASSGMTAGLVVPETKILFSVLGYAGSVNVSPLLLLFAQRYRAPSWKPRWWHPAVLWLIPAATLALAVTHGGHRLLWTDIVPSPVAGSNLLVFGHGPWYYVAVGYYAVLGAFSAFLIARAALRAQRVFVGQTAILLAGLLIPWIGSVVYTLPLNPVPGLELPPIAFSLTGLLILVGMQRLHLFRILPVARDLLVERMTDGFIVLNAHDRVVDVNPAGLALLDRARDPVGRTAAEALGPLAAGLAACRASGRGRYEVSLPGAGRYLEVGILPLTARDGSAGGTLLLVHDLTERRRMELDREKLIADLQAALGDVKAMSGLLPICASCKKIRDDKGYWRNLEKYIMEHSDARFSHSLCPDCMRRIYPEMAGQAKEETG